MDQLNLQWKWREFIQFYNVFMANKSLLNLDVAKKLDEAKEHLEAAHKILSALEQTNAAM
jgi:hypothetical protein